SRPASGLHARMARMGGAEELVRVRSAEARAAVAVLGADSLRLDHADCIYRGSSGHDWYYHDMGEVFGNIHPAESALARDIAESVISRLSGLQAGVRAGVWDITTHAPLGRSEERRVGKECGSWGLWDA